MFGPELSARLAAAFVSLANEVAQGRRQRIHLFELAPTWKVGELPIWIQPIQVAVVRSVMAGPAACEHVVLVEDGIGKVRAVAMRVEMLRGVPRIVVMTTTRTVETRHAAERRPRYVRSAS